MIEAQITCVADRTDKRLNLIFGGSSQTFNLAAGDVFARNLMPLPETCNDLMRIACAVFHADCSVSRGGDARSDMGAAWRRGFSAKVKVSDPQLWARQDVREALVDAAGFLTEDTFQFEFEDLPPGKPTQQYFNFAAREDERTFDEVILFSGGLDSFAGALQSLATGTGNVVLLTHRSSQKAITRQTKLADYLKERFPKRVLHVQITARRKATVATERTQRSRSLLFTSLGYAVARALQISTISFYENGVISQNLPISGSVVGTSATRTTHPLSLVLLERLLGALGGSRIAIRNPFIWKTKAEVLEVIRAHGAEDQIKHTVSCTNLHTQSAEVSHCGDCTQCLDRRFAVFATGMEAFEQDVHYSTDVFVGARGNGRSRQVAIEWTRHARRMAQMTPDKLANEFGLQMSRLVRGLPDLPRDEARSRIAELQTKHGKTALIAIENALRYHAGTLARGEVPVSALLATLSADDTGDTAIELNPSVEAGLEQGTAASIHGPAVRFPLQVRFYQTEGQRRSVDHLDVQDLGMVSGEPASVAHALKPVFDEDRNLGRPIDGCRYTLAKNITTTKKMSVSAVTKNIRRCREELAEFYLAMEGIPPAEPLLIQSHGPKGYRLDPTIRVIT
ncbi:7-cyano-7-deazaguanine synthase [Tabrizicola aquatica]|uniref:7-cyano-7-deazaguanine synthase n=1 Tax=Tabrizicola aquatica TaxID=909926 RepID=UPI000CD296A5|nr:7-cyano-7-deazaguanine synthase [Tabrizicola aquatica]